MRSITFKLTIAFLVVGVIGAFLVALFVRNRTRSEFDVFVSSRDKREIIHEARDYYRANDRSWDGVDEPSSDFIRDIERELGRGGLPRADFSIYDVNDQQIYSSTSNAEVLAEINAVSGQARQPISYDDTIIGYVVFLPSERPRIPATATTEREFLRRVNSAIFSGAVGASLIALIVGVVFARTIARPIGELTEATQAVASGELGRQVTVRSRDDVGRLAQSFNKMSFDLAEGNRLRRQMTADIAHDLRTPLSVILGYTEALSDGKLEGSPEIYQVLHSESVHLQHLVDDLRLLALADAGELPMNVQPIETADILERCVHAYQSQAANVNVALRWQVADALPTIVADPERLMQILGNLVTNALRYTPSDGQILLSAQPMADMVEIRVADSGRGIAAADLPYIFDRFYRADSARSHGEGVSGLGLAIVKSLVEAQGGFISVESKVGEGTVFSLQFPLST